MPVFSSMLNIKTIQIKAAVPSQSHARFNVDKQFSIRLTERTCFKRENQWLKSWKVFPVKLRQIVIKHLKRINY